MYQSPLTGRMWPDGQVRPGQPLPSLGHCLAINWWASHLRWHSVIALKAWDTPLPR